MKVVKDLGRGIKSVIRYSSEDDDFSVLEMRMHNRRQKITHFKNDKGEFYEIDFQRAVPKEDIEGVKLSLAEGRINGKLIRDKILMSTLILSREGYEALILGFFYLENTYRNTIQLEVRITENNT